MVSACEADILIRRCSDGHDDGFAVDQVLVYGIQLFTAGGVDSDGDGHVVTLGAVACVHSRFSQVGGMPADNLDNNNIQFAICLSHCLDGEFAGELQGAFFFLAHASSVTISVSGLTLLVESL